MQNSEFEMLNYDQIVRSIEYCLDPDAGCTICPMTTVKAKCGCTNELLKCAMALIKSQNQKTEELTVELEGLRGIMKSYIKAFGGESASRVPIGSKLYFILDENFSNVLHERVCECTVTAIGKNGFWTSSFVPPQDDAGEFTSFDDIGKVAFFTREEALRQLIGGKTNES